MDKYKQQIMQLYATLLRAHIALLDEILDAATSKAARRCATKASEQICSTVYHLIHDTGVMPDFDNREVGANKVALRDMEKQVFPSSIGGYTGFGLYPSN